MMPDTTFLEDIKEAITNCLCSFMSSLAVFLTFLFNVLKFILTLGKSRELLDGSGEQEPTGPFQYSEDFKNLVFDMMAYDHKKRPTLEQIR